MIPYLSIRKKTVNAKTGENIESKDILAVLDTEKLREDYGLMGYYTLVTSEIHMNENEIIEIYHHQMKIEDQSGVIKSPLGIRPMYVRKEEHIKDHLTICTTALTIIRMIQRQIKIKHPELLSKDTSYFCDMSSERIQNA